jgi:hypothetical protein
MTEPSPLYKLLYELKGEVSAQSAVLKSIDAKLTNHIEDDEKVEKRVRGLEDGANKAKGIAAVISTVGGIAGAYLLSVMRGHT